MLTGGWFYYQMESLLQNSEARLGWNRFWCTCSYHQIYVGNTECSTINTNANAGISGGAVVATAKLPPPECLNTKVSEKGTVLS